jgi:hypothetical protein
MGEERNAYEVLVGKTEEGELMHKWILMEWNEMLYTGFNWPRIRSSAALSWTWSGTFVGLRLSWQWCVPHRK